MTSNFKHSYKIFVLSKSKYRIKKFILVEFRLISKKVTLLNIHLQKLVSKYKLNGSIENKVQHSKLLINQKLLDLSLMSPRLRLTIKVFPKQKILNKLLLNKKNKKKTKNYKDGIIIKIEVKAIYLSAKLALSPIGLSKNNMAFAKHVVDFYITSRDTILFLAEKQSG